MPNVELSLNQAMLEALNEWSGPEDQGGVFPTKEAGLEWLFSEFLKDTLRPYFCDRLMASIDKSCTGVFRLWVGFRRAIENISGYKVERVGKGREKGLISKILSPSELSQRLINFAAEGAKQRTISTEETQHPAKIPSKPDVIKCVAEQLCQLRKSA